MTEIVVVAVGWATSTALERSITPSTRPSSGSCTGAAEHIHDALPSM